MRTSTAEHLPALQLLSETLQAAMRVLQELTQGNRQIGIISHVAELREQIAQQIIVTKDAQGISTARLSRE